MRAVLLALALLGVLATTRGTQVPPLPQQKPGCSEARLAALYGDHPYPARDPADERPGHVAFPTYDDPALLSHIAFGGRLAWDQLDRPFRALVAGGGTGDATVQLAVLLEQAGVAAEVVQVDLSAKSLRVAAARVARHPLQRVSVRFVQGSILRLGPAELGLDFDLINCVGVAHHTPDPQDTLRRLEALLAPMGALVLGVYGALGRTGVYEMQALMATALDSDDPASVPGAAGMARAALAALPPGNWLRRNAVIMASSDLDPARVSDEGVMDMLLNPCDVAYTLPQLGALAAGAGLRLQDVSVPAAYAPLPTGSAELDARVAALPWLRRAAVAELQRGDIAMHNVWLVREAHPFLPASAASDADIDEGTILCPAIHARDMRVANQRAGLRDPHYRYTGWQVGMSIYGSAEPVALGDLPPLAPVFLQSSDCRRTLRELYDLLMRAGWVQYPLSYAQFEAQAREFVRTVDSVRMMALLRAPMGMERPS